MELESLIRKNILNLIPYSCARSEFNGEASVYLDANENPYNRPYNRYPDPLQRSLKEKIAKLKKIQPCQIMIGNGSDEPIDLVFRIFCEPQQNNVVSIDPTYGMYQVAANINHIEYKKVLLDENYQLNAERLLNATDKYTKVIFLCSPNNPSGNLLNKLEIMKVISFFQGIVVIDEAYIDFSNHASWLVNLDKYPNLIVLQTFSKAWGMASARCGLAFASKKIINFFNKIKYPYNINFFTQNFISKCLNKENKKNEWVKMILSQRQLLTKTLQTLNNIVEKVYHSDTNFLLVKVKNATNTYNELIQKGIIVRNRNSISLCNNCLRITVGTENENRKLIEALKKSNEKKSFIYR
ncbi:MAG: histidinol-phosphate transaminase [Candidatus Azobacteroides pseudotrichonymphae]|jgi:histidinol-phosphate aminotransferase|uniref:Histidinol-phosphate aminotransferase n=2 Tax=Candidatus Azobacteroides TaxID=511434 RepID=B6YQ23_AZOPC|nr:histidinol-phosphate aminotransferase [Candidatus Azobacteroides pseudotrichonymphae genomovar. CFP2]GMO33338.1 MAG: histidinol-phosphate transaminase [Candidatus Azobacteroides pseudotrichonymphae]